MSVAAPSRRGSVSRVSGVGREPWPPQRAARRASATPSLPSAGGGSVAAVAEQLEQLRDAFATLSDVLVDELDAVRSDAARRWELAEAHLNKHAQSLRVLRAELALLRDEVHTGGARADAVRDTCDSLAAELAAVGSAQQLTQQLVQEERTEAARIGSGLEEKLDTAVASLTEQLARHRDETEGALSALDQDASGARVLVDELRASSASALDTHRDKLLQCATAIERQWTTGKELAQDMLQRCDSLASTQALIHQQLQDRLEASRKENARWRLSLEDAVRSAVQDVTALKVAGARGGGGGGGEPATDAQLRRMLDERDEALRRELAALGRAVHALADSLDVPDPHAGARSRS